ncbi:MAG: ATP-grasp domain-containing protein [Ignavibacteriales bacterium]|nr:MAG: ATP-grasp domain-containing protein [Ignavibacteriales bacterium]
MNVALTYNVRPEEESIDKILASNEIVSSKSNLSQTSQPKFNDTYAEWDTFETIDAVRNALSLYNNVNLVEADENAFEKLRTLKPDIVFNVAEGRYGISREAQIPAMLDMLRIPYTGSDPLTLATCLDKARTKEILTYHGIRTAKFIRATSKKDLKDFTLQFPVFIKPIGEGSSKGIFNNSFIQNMKELEEAVETNSKVYNQPSLVEEYLPGQEFTVALLGNDGDLNVLPIVEMNFDSLPGDLVPIYSYEAKWIVDKKENPLDIFKCPAQISNDLEQKIKSVVTKTYKVLNCKDWSRIDVRLDSDGEPNIIEINPLPGILPDPKDNSCYPKAARAFGLNYNDMINYVLFVSAKRYKLL